MLVKFKPFIHKKRTNHLSITPVTVNDRLLHDTSFSMYFHILKRGMKCHLAISKKSTYPNNRTIQPHNAGFFFYCKVSR